MKLLELSYTENSIREIPLSTQCVAVLPDSSFKPDFYRMGDPWKDAVIDLICLIYLDLVLNRIIQLAYQIKDFKFGFIRRRNIYFIPGSNNRSNWNIPLGWFENEIIVSLMNCRPESDNDNNRIFKRQIELLFDSILGENVIYANPWKKIAEKIIINDDQKHWKFHYDKKRLNSVQELVLEIDEQKRLYFENQINNTKNKIEILKNDLLFKEFSNVLRRKLKKEINTKLDNTTD